ncbi:MAG: K+/H+ antiporter subunit F [Rhodobacteraceae bacterium]|nr:K+/H+ antiporter subunit F [Paracoccaceae bacterium]
MITYALIFALICFGLALMMNLWRITRASNIVDRILALDTMVINAIAILTLIGILGNTRIYFEASMLFAMVGFVSTVAYCRFILRGDIIE